MCNQTDEKQANTEHNTTGKQRVETAGRASDVQAAKMSLSNNDNDLKMDFCSTFAKFRYFQFAYHIQNRICKTASKFEKGILNIL